MPSGEQVMGPSYEGSVVVDIGGDVGALVVYTEPSWAGLELEIEAVGHRAPRTHTSVRERRLRHGSVFAAVFPTLHAGTYQLPRGRVVVRPGAVTELHLDPRPNLDPTPHPKEQADA